MQLDVHDSTALLQPDASLIMHAVCMQNTARQGNKLPETLAGYGWLRRR